MPADRTSKSKAESGAVNSAQAHAQKLHDARHRLVAAEQKDEIFDASYVNINPDSQPQAFDTCSVLVLHGTNGLYSGETPEYLVKDNMITIKGSDGQSACIPTSEQRQRDTSSGLVDYYYPLSPNHKRYITFMRNVGQLIAWHVFHKGMSNLSYLI